MAGFNLPNYDQTKLSDPQYLLSQKIISDATSGTPVEGPFGAMARTLQGALGGYIAKKSKETGEARDASAARTLNDALDLGSGRPAETQTYGDGTTIDWNEQKPNQDLMVKTLMANPDTVGVGTDMMARRMDTKQAAEAKLQEMMMKAYEPMTPYQRAQLGSENLSDAQGNIIPKYNQDAIARMGATTPPAGMSSSMPPAIQPPGVQTGMQQQNLPPMAPNGNIPANAFGNGLLPPPSGMNGPAMGSAPPGAPMPAAMPRAAPQPLPTAMGTPMASSPKGDLAGQEQAAKNIADRAAPKAADDNVAKMTNAMALLDQADTYNQGRFDTGVKGAATQMVGNILGDSALSPEQAGKRDAQSNLAKTADAIKAELLKATVGGSQISNADVNFVGSAGSFNPQANQGETKANIQHLREIATRKRDIEAAEQQAALEGRAFGPNDVAKIYAQHGIDYATGKKLETPNPTALTIAAKPATEADYNKLPSGTPFTAPDGTQRIKP